jgi:hypothetical protein
MLVNLAGDAELWHTPGSWDADGYATIPVNDHGEHWPISSKAFRRWLGKRYYDAFGKVPNAQAMQDALNVLAGKAVHDGREHSIYLRVAELENRIYLDLCDGQWRAIEIDGDGWRVLDRPPVRFRRAKAMLPLPVPTTEGSIAELRQFLTVCEKDWPLVLGWLVAAMRPTGPYPVLCLHGEQGSGKSTQARVLRSLIDPNSSPVRAEPRNAQDLAIAANNGHVIALDNLSWVPPWLSDALCRLSTGGGFFTRTLYENDAETIFDGQRPIVVNGIEEVATRPDLLDRSILIVLPTIPEDKRRTEAAYRSAFDQARPRILGALLSAVSVGLRALPSVSLPQLPRMADFAVWATACEQGLGLKAGTFFKAYMSNRAAANELALEVSPIVAPLRTLLENRGGVWDGTATELLADLTRHAGDASHSREWPAKGNVLSGKLRRLAPNLRKSGIMVEFHHAKHARRVSIRSISENTVTTVTGVTTADKTRPEGDASAAGERHPSVTERHPPSQESAQKTGNPSTVNAGDAGDGSGPVSSGHGAILDDDAVIL